MGVISNDWFDRVLLDSKHVQTLKLTDVQTPFLGPLVPLKGIGSLVRKTTCSVTVDRCTNVWLVPAT